MKTRKNLTSFYIVRHGETEWNIKKIMQGRGDSSLTKTGEYQAKLFAKKIKNIHFDAIYSSDVLRAKRTARAVALDRKMAIFTSKALRERYYGKYDGKPIKQYKEELRHLIDKRKKLNSKDRVKFKLTEDIESDEEIISRFITFLRELAIAYSGKRLLIVSHGSIIRTFLIHLGYISYRDADDNAIHVNNTAYVVVESDGVDFFVKEVNGIEKREKGT